jgi:hypothetical protein
MTSITLLHYYIENSGEWPYKLDGGPRAMTSALRAASPSSRASASVIGGAYRPIQGSWYGGSGEPTGDLIQMPEWSLIVAGLIMTGPIGSCGGVSPSVTGSERSEAGQIHQSRPTFFFASSDFRTVPHRAGVGTDPFWLESLAFTNLRKMDLPRRITTVKAVWDGSVGAANFLMIIGLIVGGRVLLETGESVTAMRCACMLAISLTAA